MSYKRVKAIAVGSVGTSVGIRHYDPKRKEENGRYQGGVLPEKDADKAVRKGLVEITGDATKKDYDKELIDLRMSAKVQAGDLKQEIADAGSIGSPSVQNLALVAHGADTPAVTGDNPPAPDAPPVEGGASPDAPPAPGDEGAAGAKSEYDLSLLDKGVKKQGDDIDAIKDAAHLKALLAAEEAGKTRATTLDMLKKRIADLGAASN